MAVLKIKINGIWTEIPVLQGKSAYASAVTGGYIGTESEFNTLLYSTPTHVSNNSIHIQSGTTINGHQLSGGTFSITANETGAYTTGQTDTLLLGKSNTGHTHSQYLTGVTGVLPIVVTDTTNPVVSINNATPLLDGAMSANDKTKLDSLSSGSTYTTLTQFNNHTGDTSLHLTTTQNTLLDGISGVTFTEINYLSGLTGNTQTQLNSKVDKVFSKSLVFDTEISKIHTQNTDSILLSPDKITTVVQTDNAGNLLITGNIIQSGSTYETHLNHIYTTGDTLNARNGAVGGLGAGELSGIVVEKYDGINNGTIGIANDGLVKIGNSTGVHRIPTIEDTPTNDYLTKYDSASGNLITIVRNTSSIPSSTDANYLTDVEKTNVNYLTGVTSNIQTQLNNRVLYTGSTGNVDLGAHAIKSSKFQLKTDAINTLEEGEIGWNAKAKTPEFRANGATIQINQEQNLTVKNATAITLLNGRLVRITGYDSINDYYTVEYSDNSSEETSYVDFMLTEDILAGEVGTAIKTGIIHDINTSGGTQGGLIYLGTNGHFLFTEPTYPTKIVICGTCGNVNSSTGDVFVDINKPSQYITNSIITALVLKATAFPGICQLCPIYANDIVVDYVNLTVTIATIKNGETISASNPIRFFTDGGGIIKKWEKSTLVTFTFTNTSGTWYFYFDNTGTPIATQTRWTDFNTISPIYGLYWNATLTGEERSVSEAWECHLNDISATDHNWKHSQGSIWTGGGDTVSNLIANTNGVPNTSPNIDGRNTVISLTNCSVSDDGLEYTVVNSVVSAKFNQDLGNTTASTLTSLNSGQFPIRINTAGGLVYTLPPTRFPFPWDVTTNRPEYITAAGVRTIVSDNRWFVTYIYSLQDPRFGKAIKIVSEVSDFTSVASAQASTWESLVSSIGTFTDSEIRPLYKLIFYCNHTTPSQPYDIAVKYSALVSIDNYRKVRITTAGTASGSISAASVITIPPSGYTSTNAQGLFDELAIPKVFDGTITGDGTALSPYSVIEKLGISGSMTYNPDETPNVYTTALGTKTYAYNPDGTLATITGTGIYPNKTFVYSGGKFQSVTVS